MWPYLDKHDEKGSFSCGLLPVYIVAHQFHSLGAANPTSTFGSNYVPEDILCFDKQSRRSRIVKQHIYLVTYVNIFWAPLSSLLKHLKEKE